MIVNTGAAVISLRPDDQRIARLLELPDVLILDLRPCREIGEKFCGKTNGAALCWRFASNMFQHLKCMLTTK